MSVSAVPEVTICEVGPRDGLQNDPAILAAPVRADLVERLTACGLRRIEAVSFVNAARVPQMAEPEHVVALVERAPGASFAGLALNVRGYERLRETEVDQVRFALSCTEGFSERNSGCSVAEALRAARAVAGAARRDGRKVAVTLMVAFGCPFEGHVSESTVLSLAESVLELEPDELVLADTIGVATPGHVRRLLVPLSSGKAVLGAHLHDTRNTAVANAFAALDAGATVLDSAIGGLGGCPFAPGASGNLATEDLVYALERDAIDTGVDLDELISVARWLQDLLGHPLPGRLHRVGRPMSGDPHAVLQAKPS